MKFKKGNSVQRKRIHEIWNEKKFVEKILLTFINVGEELLAPVRSFFNVSLSWAVKILGSSF